MRQCLACPKCEWKSTRKPTAEHRHRSCLGNEYSCAGWEKGRASRSHSCSCVLAGPIAGAYGFVASLCLGAGAPGGQGATLPVLRWVCRATCLLLWAPSSPVPSRGEQPRVFLLSQEQAEPLPEQTKPLLWLQASARSGGAVQDGGVCAVRPDRV